MRNQGIAGEFPVSNYQGIYAALSGKGARPDWSPLRAFRPRVDLR